jgi:hypothetical protein
MNVRPIDRLGLPEVKRSHTFLRWQRRQLARECYQAGLRREQIWLWFAGYPKRRAAMSGLGPIAAETPDRSVRFATLGTESRQAAHVKSFGRHLAYESLRGTNPRVADDGLWVFLFSAERGEVTTGSGSRGT